MGNIMGIIQEVMIPQCHTRHHTYHIYVPWLWGNPYDKLCDVCGHAAAWTAGNGISLCDCCAQDWSDWTDYYDSIHKVTRGFKKLWDKEYQVFRKYARECLKLAGLI